MAAGADSSTAHALLAALPLGSAAVKEIPGATTAMIEAAGGAFVQSYVVGLRFVSPLPNLILPPSL